jgi:hypothetical protein
MEALGTILVRGLGLATITFPAGVMAASLPPRIPGCSSARVDAKTKLAPLVARPVLTRPVCGQPGDTGHRRWAQAARQLTALGLCWKVPRRRCLASSGKRRYSRPGCADPGKGTQPGRLHVVAPGPSATALHDSG